MSARARNLRRARRVLALACAALTSACSSSGISRTWVGGTALAEVTGDWSYRDEDGQGYHLTGPGFPEIAGRALDAEVRVDWLPLELVIGEEWSRHGPSTDAHVAGVRWYPGMTEIAGGAFVEAVTKFARDDNGGSSAIDGFELRCGVATPVARNVMLDLLLRYAYFDTSDQGGDDRHVSEGGIGVGLRVGF